VAAAARLVVGIVAGTGLRRCDDFGQQRSGGKRTGLDQAVPMAPQRLHRGNHVEISPAMQRHTHLRQKLKLSAHRAARPANPFANGVELSARSRK